MLKNYYLTTNENIIDLINPEDSYLTNQTKNSIEYTSIRYNSDLYFYKLKFNNIKSNEVLNYLSLTFGIVKDLSRPNLMVDVYYGSGSSVDSNSMYTMYREIIEYRNYPIKKEVECEYINNFGILKIEL